MNCTKKSFDSRLRSSTIKFQEFRILLFIKNNILNVDFKFNDTRNNKRSRENNENNFNFNSRRNRNINENENQNQNQKQQFNDKESWSWSKNMMIIAKNEKIVKINSIHQLLSQISKSLTTQKFKKHTTNASNKYFVSNVKAKNIEQKIVFN